MFFPMPPWPPYPPIILPDPETVIKYVRMSTSALQALRKEAKKKGREHKQYFEEQA